MTIFFQGRFQNTYLKNSLDQKFLDQMKKLQGMDTNYKGKLFSLQIKHIKISTVSTHIRRAGTYKETGIFHRHVLEDSTLALFQSRMGGR